MTAGEHTQNKALRKLFLAIFLRGRGARGLQKQTVPKSVATKLWRALAIYAFLGIFSLMFVRQPLFVLSIYLHASTLMFIGMFVASSAGEALFNKEEADILLHRPITARALLWAKVRVMIEVSIWLAAAFNLIGLAVGTYLSPARGMFLVAHILSVVLNALFCTGLVVVLYQLCLRWFGRERLDGLITTTQTLMAVAIVAGSQLAPQFMMRNPQQAQSAALSPWVFALPPAWFAGLDDAIAGSHSTRSLLLGGLALAATFMLLAAGFGTLARDYGAGLQTLNEAGPARPGSRPRSRFLQWLATVPPFSWWLHNPVERAAFLLSAAYLVRDRDVKLRVYPGIAPMMMMPIIMLLPNRPTGGGNPSGGMMVALGGVYLGMIPLLAIGMMKHSQQWQAGDIFRLAPIAGPGPLYHGVRKAVLFLLTLPMLLIFAGACWLMGVKPQDLELLLPGLITIPLFALLACVTTNPTPLSTPPESARSAGRGLRVLTGLFISMPLAGLAVFARATGYFWAFIVLELVVCAIVYQLLLLRCRAARWKPIDEDSE